jgi:hypothetical protein
MIAVSKQGPSVLRPRSVLSAGFLLLAVASFAWGEDIAESKAVANVSPPAVDQVIYKGLVGTVLDAVPMDPVQRANLQRTNAVISGPLSARSLAALAGIANPALMIVGLIWGMWSASNINPEAADSKTAVAPVGSGDRVESAAGDVALTYNTFVGRELPADPAPAPAAVAMNSVANAGATAPPQSQVIKIWLPQRSTD